ncbi:AAA family ATPase [Candidatus Desantisbacteria bacterium CG1_02_38_46]|uniref:AAA family ATPase n=3 Tax=unclassified Candidatus Desantisiibacteriota TaxID=3106372 RepID=A0A2H9P9M1_9BACT|nr:MAG: AAA family ATPase [Candidatus Desantisbacteria bacterium CG1_02_38_46]PIU50775.1 MAG: AAA family ATPase [Candidatus Desantisbacteria bacterium CG07_land_8_20_14_0_80_39_15]PIZ14945.1 MAG: AAA family ATPase [Candidatus Desantisbacteria bacterium CG_4_10_14_0_8_um_filter_39_17]
MEEKELFLEKKFEEPLATRMKPATLEEFVGQEQILGSGKLLRRAIESDRLSSLIFFGPPGTGKTALAYIIATKTGAHFIRINAVTSGVAEIRDAILEAKRRRSMGQRTILFIDEIHRFNKLQQDALLPDVENGTVILVGTTVENPYFTVSQALISRSQVFEFKVLKYDEIKVILDRAIVDKERGLGKYNVEITSDAMKYLISGADGDARQCLNAFELSVITTKPENGKVKIDLDVMKDSIQKKIVYDRDGDAHYDTISAFIKSMRGSDPDAALYWLAKMLYAGEDPRFIARRVVICASEDVGNADPQALVVASAALQAILFIGMPEAKIPLAQAVVYIATAPKSNASYAAINKALEDVEKEETAEVADHLKVASYKGAEKLGRGGYQYPHDPEIAAKIKSGEIKQEYLGKKKRYYFPLESGYEIEIKKRIRK